jgi:hypothetical protein
LRETLFERCKEDAVAKVTTRSIIDYIVLTNGLRRKNVEKEYDLYILEVIVEWKCLIEESSSCKVAKEVSTTVPTI